MNPYLLWLIYFPLQLAVSIFCKLTTPFVALFITKKYTKEYVKLYGNEIGFDREYLIKPFYYWQTFDHPVDHYFWGSFSKYSIFPFVRNCSIQTYKSSIAMRYLYRCLWLYRNTAYGFAQYTFGLPADAPQFQIKKQIPLGFGYYNDINVGWKTHRDFPDRNMYAGRIIGIRKAK